MAVTSQPLFMTDQGGNDTITWQPSYEEEAVHLWKPNVLLGSLICLVAYLAWEQISFQLARRKPNGKQLPGPRFPVPLVGAVVEMVLDPFKFWEEQRKLSFPGLSCNTLLGKFMVFITDPDSCRTALSVNSPDSLLMAVHPSGKAILGPNNLAFKHGPPHKAIRKSFLALFTRKALGTYVQQQDSIIREHLALWGQCKEEREIRLLVRDLNAATSQEVFAGPYLGDAAQRDKFSACFQDMTQGFLAFPLCFPGTAVWRARQGRLWILAVLRKGAAASKAAIKAGQEPRCLMDFWAQRCLEEMAEAEEAQQPPPEHTRDDHMADTVMDFLFASQDASTASLVWMMCLMAEYPDVLNKVRAEQLQIRGAPEAPVTGDNVAHMTYTRQVVKEVLRYRPPAPMVPQVCQRPFKVSDTYTAPKGSLLMPSIIAANMQGWTSPEKFDPDRFSPARAEDQKCAKNFLTFGYGPHYCVGKEYAINHLTAFLAILATNCEWQRRTTEQSKDDSQHWLYLPTIYPADSLITFQLKPQ